MTTSTPAIATVTRAGAIYKATDGYKNLPSMNEPGSIAAIGDSLSNPEGSALAGGFFELRKSEPLVYEYTYDEMKLVFRGVFTLTDVKTGESMQASEGEIVFFPKGSIIKFETDDHAIGFFVGDRTFAP